MLTQRLMRKTLYQQQGVALISVLLIFALVTIIAADILTNNYIDVKKAQNQQALKQAYHYALAGEQLARQLLWRDYVETKNLNDGLGRDNLKEEWAKDDYEFELNEGRLKLTIVDLQGRFNINGIIDQKTGSVVSVKEQQFQRLLKHLSLQKELSAVLGDWLDSDNIQQIKGAEDDVYQAKKPAFLTANALLADSSELRLLKGFDINSYIELSPNIATLPTTTLINLNTATESVLWSLSTDLTTSFIGQIISQQHRGGYDSVNQWLDQPFAAPFVSLGSALSVYSEYFEVNVSSIYAGQTSQITTVLYREAKTGKMHVIKRQLMQK